MKILSAPIQGFTDYAWRNIHSQVFAGDIDCYYTPFLRIEKGEFRNKDLRDIDPSNNTACQLTPQVIASPKEQFRLLVEKVTSLGYRHFDINMGCPFSPLVKRHCGAGILPYPDEVKAMLDTIKEFPGIEFSIKMRLGVENSDEWLALMPIIAAAEPKHVTMHPRTARQQYGGEVDMLQFAKFYSVAPFPVVYNGDILSLADIDKIAAAYPQLHAIMIGRGLLSNPALVSPSHDDIERYTTMHDRLMEHYASHLSGDAHLLLKMKSLWEYFLTGIGNRKARKKIIKSSTINKYRAATEEFWATINANDNED